VTHATGKHPGELNPEWKPVLEDFERQNARPRTLLRERLADRNVDLVARETLYARFPVCVMESGAITTASSMCSSGPTIHGGLSGRL
jgi:hypothetical protein